MIHDHHAPTESTRRFGWPIICIFFVAHFVYENEDNDIIVINYQYYFTFSIAFE